MAKKITGYIKLQLPAGKATPAAACQVLHSVHYGLAIPVFTKEFNERTKEGYRSHHPCRHHRLR